MNTILDQFWCSWPEFYFLFTGCHVIIYCFIKVQVKWRMCWKSIKVWVHWFMFILSRMIQHTKVKMQCKVLVSTFSIVCWFTPHQMKWGMFHTGSVVARYKCNELLKRTLWHIYAQTCALRSSQCRFSMSGLHIYEIHVEYTLKSCCPLQLSNATALAITQWWCLWCNVHKFYSCWQSLCRCSEEHRRLLCNQLTTALRKQ